MDATTRPASSGNGSSDANATSVLRETPPNDSSATLPPPAPGESSASGGARWTARPSDLLEIGMMLFQEAENLLRSGRKRKIKIQLGRRTVAEIPLATGAMAVMGIAMASVAVSRLNLELE